MKNPSDKFERLLDAMEKEALDFIEQEARKILKTQKALNEFVMGMGVVFFTLTESSKTVGLNERIYSEYLDDFINRWDGILHLTGNPMRFTASGPKITD